MLMAGLEIGKFSNQSTFKLLGGPKEVLSNVAHGVIIIGASSIHYGESTITFSTTDCTRSSGLPLTANKWEQSRTGDAWSI